tara:strand:- start:1041 stop:4862 length:3822 start_codon:yes stop_codon:yes gene_type:complete
MADEPIIVEEKEEIVVDENANPITTGPFKMSFSKQEFADLYQTFEAESKKPDAQFANGIQGFASTLVDTLRFDPYMKDRMDYNSLRTGNAPILAELGLEGKSVTDAQIIELFAQDDKGEPIVADPSFFEGMKRQALPSLGFAGGFYAGMKGGNIALAGVPPVTPPTAILRLGGPLVSGIVTGLGTSFLGKEATDVLMGEEPIIVPGTKANYEAGKTFVDTLPFVLTPWSIGREGIDIGGQLVVNNAQKFIGPIMQGQNRVPSSAKAVAGVEKAISGLRPTTTRGAVTTGIVEGGALAATTGGAREAERIAPDNPYIRFGAEALTSVTGAFAADLAANRVPMLYNFAETGVKNLWGRLTGSNKSELMRQYNISESELDDVGNFIIDQLEKNGENPEAIIAALNDPKFDKFLVDESGRQIELDPATKAASVTLLSLQNQFIGANPQAYGNDAQARMRSGIDALRRGLLALYADGSETALQDAAIIQTGLFQGVLDSKVAAATDRAMSAMTKVRGGKGIDRDNAKTIFDTLDSQYDAARAEESALWKKIPSNVEVTRFIDANGNESDIPNFISTFSRMIDEEPPEVQKAILKNDELRFLKEFVDRKTNDLGLDIKQQEFKPAEIIGLNANELFRIRSRALAMGKRLSADNKDDEARFAWAVADALLADLNSFGMGVNQAYDTARSYSRAFNDVFTRAYAGEVLGTQKNGAPKIPIDQIRSRMMKGDGAYLRAAQLDSVAQFGAQQSLTNILASEVGPEFAETGQTLLAQFNDAIDPATDTIDLPKMRQWYGANKDLIESVPGLNTRIVDAMNTATNLRDAEEVLLRSLRADALNPDGSLNTTGLSNWMNQEDNKRLMQMFPGVAEDLQDVRKAEYLLKQTKSQNAADLASERAGIGLYELLPDKTSNAATVISLAVSNKQTRPFAILNKYMRMIDDVGEDGFTVIARDSQNYGQTWTQAELRDGMRKAMYDSIFEVASNGKRFSPIEAYNRLFAPHPNGNDVAVADWMLSNKLLDKDTLEDTKNFLQQMSKIELFTTKAKPGQTDEFFKDIGEGVKILAAMGGSVGGTQLRQMFGGGGTGDLIAAGRGARFGEQLANKYLAELPQSLQANRVQIVLENENLLRQVLAKDRSQRGKETLLRQIGSSFAKAYGLDPARRVGGEAIQETFSFEGDVKGQEIPPQVVPTDAGKNTPATVDQTAPATQAPNQTVPVNPSGPPIPPAPQPQPQPQPQFNNPGRFEQGSIAPAGGGQVDRARFAALFPEDRELMGIGSLMGQV